MGELPPVSGVITLLTDFGLSDPFLGVMTGVILRGFAEARVVELCHGLRPQAIADGNAQRTLGVTRGAVVEFGRVPRTSRA